MNNAPYTIIADTREQMLEIAMALTASGYHFKARNGVGATWIIELTARLANREAGQHPKMRPATLNRRAMIATVGRDEDTNALVKRIADFLGSTYNGSTYETDETNGLIARIAEFHHPAHGLVRVRLVRTGGLFRIGTVMGECR